MAQANSKSKSHYHTIGIINEEHDIYLVQDTATKQVFIKKTMSVYNKLVYDSLLTNPVKGLPVIREMYQDNDDNLVVIEEYISGHSLEDILKEKKSLNPNDIVKYVCKLCDILSNLHNRDPLIIHRDIKPSNIIIAPNDEPYLIDLNAAKFYNASEDTDTVLLGTQGYAAPEQYGFGSSSPQTDIYAIGILMKTLLYGSYNSKNDITSPLGLVIEKCTKLDVNERYENVNELKAALIACNTRASSETAPAKAATKPPREYPFLPPGFRHLNTVHMIIASLVYCFTLWITLTLYVEEYNDAQLWSSRILSCLALIFIELFSNNYLNMQKKVPFCNSKNKNVRIINIILFDILIFCLAAFISAFLDTFL